MLVINLSLIFAIYIFLAFKISESYFGILLFLACKFSGLIKISFMLLMNLFMVIFILIFSATPIFFISGHEAINIEYLYGISLFIFALSAIAASQTKTGRSYKAHLRKKN